MGDIQKALFVCLGNTCRSPIAEAVFKHLLKERGIYNQWIVDSAGLADWHVGNLPNPRACAVLDLHKVQYNHKARQICPKDFTEFDYIFGMDAKNISDLAGHASAVKDSKAQVLLLGDFDPNGDRFISDPYFDNHSKGFEKCFQQCMRSCNAFLDKCNKP